MVLRAAVCGCVFVGTVVSTSLAIGIIYAIIAVVYAYLFFRYRVLSRKEKAASRVRWREPQDFRCPVCQHPPADHYSRTGNRFYGCGHLTEAGKRMSPVHVKEAPRFQVRCLCARDQGSLLKEAEEWSYRPPSTPVLMSYLKDFLEPKVEGDCSEVTEEERMRFRRGDVKWRDADQVRPSHLDWHD